MQFIEIIKYISIASIAIMSNEPKIYGQTNSETSLYNLFDTIVGKENLGINNGTLHNNQYRTIANKNKYYVNDEFDIGDVNYDGQFYPGVNLKYDILEDHLVFKQKGETDNLSINLNSSKVVFFYIKNKKFLNLGFESSKKPEFIEGFYEENFIGKEMTLYIKHYKERKEVYYFDGFYSDYFYNNEFVVKYKNTFNKVDSEYDFIKLFPDYERVIRDYYNRNSRLEKSDKIQFMESLAKQINNNYQKKSN